MIWNRASGYSLGEFVLCNRLKGHAHSLSRGGGYLPESKMLTVHEPLLDSALKHLNERIKEAVGVEDDYLSAKEVELAPSDDFGQLLKCANASGESYGG